MSKASTIDLIIQVIGDGLNPLTIAPSFVSNTTSPATHSIVPLINGNTTITPPSNAQVALLIPITGAVAAKTFKGSTTDTGYALSTNQPSLLALGTTGAFYIASTTSENLDVYFF